MKGILTAIIGIFLFSSVLYGGESPYYYSFAAKPGDGIIVVLNRYELDEYDCNVDKFLELNQLSKTDYLLEGKEYKLPVLIYQYNGKSIRSTLGINDMETAKRI